MAEIGAWKNFDDLEDSLTLMELMELYDISNTRQTRLMKTIAAAMGAEFDDEEEENSAPSKPKPSFTEDGQYIPGAINSVEDAQMVNGLIAGAGGLFGYEKHY